MARAEDVQKKLIRLLETKKQLLEQQRDVVQKMIDALQAIAADIAAERGKRD